MFKFRKRSLRSSVVVVLIGLLASALSVSAVAAHHSGVQSSGVFRFEDASPVAGATATLRRNNNGVAMKIRTSELDPRTTYTIWWIIFNNPDACTHGGVVGGVVLQCGEGDLTPFGGDDAVMSSALYATGHVVGRSGHATFAAHLREGQLTNDVLFGPGLLDSRQAEIHLVVRSHGAPIRGMVYEQTHTFLGGCDINECVDQQFATFPAP